MVDRIKALNGAPPFSPSLLAWFGDFFCARNLPTLLNREGMYLLCAAATVKRPVTKMLPFRAPAITRQIRIAKAMPIAFPRRFLIATCGSQQGLLPWRTFTNHSDSICDAYRFPGKENVVDSVDQDVAYDYSWQSSVYCQW